MHLPINEVPGSLRDFVRKEDKVSVFGPYLEEGTYKIAKLIDAADRPDSVHARHILLGAGQSRSIERARSLADSLLGLVKKGVSFEKLAASFSDDKGSAQLGGDLGWFTEGKMIMQFNNACFSARKGDILKVETTYGMHVIEILDQSAKVRKYNTGIIDRKITPGSATNQQIYSQASMFAGTNVTYDKFNSAIASLKLGKRKASDVAPNQKTLPGLDNCRALVIALFSTPEGKIVTDNSDQAVFEIDDKYVVAYCTRVQEEGIAPVKDVESDIKFALYREKKAGLLSAEFRVVNQAGSTLEDIAGRLNLNIQDATRVNFRSFSVPGVGAEPALAAAATVARQGTVAGPVEGNNGVYMLEVNNVSDEGAGNDIKLTRDRLMASTRIRGGYEAYEALRDEAKVIDKRYKFY
jgi:peptidyl-prolyl cis-trans isomerase D